MGMIVSDHAFKRGARAAGLFADDIFTRKVELQAGQRLCVLDTENRVLHAESLHEMPRANVTDDYEDNGNLGNMADLARFVCIGIQARVSNHPDSDGRVIVLLGGFTADTGDARDLTVLLDYRALPERRR